MIVVSVSGHETSYHLLVFSYFHKLWAHVRKDMKETVLFLPLFCFNSCYFIWWLYNLKCFWTGKFTDSAHLYLLHGKTTKATETARQSSDKHLLAQSLLVHAQVTMRQKYFTSEEKTPEEKEEQKQELLQHLQEAIDLSLKVRFVDIISWHCVINNWTYSSYMRNISLHLTIVFHLITCE